MQENEDAIVEDREQNMGLLVEEGLRHRIPWGDRASLGNDLPGLHDVEELLEDDVSSCLGEEEDGVGCPLPSTPEDDRLLDCEV